MLVLKRFGCISTLQEDITPGFKLIFLYKTLLAKSMSLFVTWKINYKKWRTNCFHQSANKIQAIVFRQPILSRKMPLLSSLRIYYLCLKNATSFLQVFQLLITMHHENLLIPTPTHSPTLLYIYINYDYREALATVLELVHTI